MALEDGILTLAQTNGVSFIERLVKALGVKEVLVVLATPVK